MNHICESCIYCTIINEYNQEKHTHCEIHGHINGYVTKCKYLSFEEKTK